MKSLVSNHDQGASVHDDSRVKADSPAKRAAYSEFNRTSCRSAHIVGYVMGESAHSLVANGLLTFTMLCYADALGMAPSWVGVVFFLSIGVEVVMQPIVGWLSDRTGSRWGKRHPYIVVGGILMAFLYLFVWCIPDFVRGDHLILGAYVLVWHVGLRVSITVFNVPYIALGYEITDDIRQQMRLQSGRQIANMVANLAGPALAWSLFFRDHGGLRGTQVLQNYALMAGAFSSVMILLVCSCAFATRSFARSPFLDRASRSGKPKAGVLASMRCVLAEPQARRWLAFLVMLTIGMAIMSGMQMLVYEHCLRLMPGQKTLAHGATMVMFGLGAVLSPFLGSRHGRENGVLVGGVTSVAACVLLVSGVALGWLSVSGKTIGLTVFCPFVALHSTFWFGCGMMFPLAQACIAELSRSKKAQSDDNNSGVYAASVSVSQQVALSVGMMVCGSLMSIVGFVAGAEIQSQATLWWLAVMAFGVVAVVIAMAILIIQGLRQAGGGFAMPTATMP